MANNIYPEQSGEETWSMVRSLRFKRRTDWEYGNGPGWNDGWQ